MKLIVEQLRDVSFNQENKFHYLVGPFIQTGIVNANKRKYIYENVKILLMNIFKLRLKKIEH